MNIPSLSCEVERGYLEIPPCNDLTKIHRYESGVYLDGPVRKLARVCAMVDVALALRLHRLRRGKSFLRLGYARFVDYARERLDLAERTAQETARLGAGLERLPPLHEALSGGRLTWSAALQVARVATVEDVGAWIGLACSMSVRELTAEVTRVVGARPRARRSVVGDLVGSECGVAPATSEANAVDGGGSGMGSGPTSAVEGGADSARGSGPMSAPDGVEGSLSEKAGADDASEGDPSKNDDASELPTTWRLYARSEAKRNWDAALELCSLVAQADLCEPEATELLLAEFVSGTDGSAVDEQEEARIEQAARKHSRREARREPHRPPVADRSPDLPPHWEPPELSAESRVVLDVLTQPVGDDPFALDASMRKLQAGRRAVEMDLARLLHTYRSLGLCRHVGYATFAEYVRERLGISSRRAGFLATLDRRLVFLPATDAAVRSGTIGLVAASLLARVASELTEDAWLARAREVPVARLRREVEWAVRQLRAEVSARPPLPPEGELPSALDDVTAEVLARAGVLGDSEPISAVEGDAVSATGSGPTSAVEGDAGLATGSGPMSAVGGGSPVDFGSRAEMRLRLTPHAQVLWERCRRALQEVRRTGVSDADVVAAVGDAFLRTWLPFWVRAVLAGDPIAVREKFRCAVPGCTVHGGSAHHIRYRGLGGSDEPENLAFVCFGHHILGEHADRIRISGRAPDRLRVELGLRPDGTPLGVFVGGKRQPRAAPSVAAGAAGMGMKKMKTLKRESHEEIAV